MDAIEDRYLHLPLHTRMDCLPTLGEFARPFVLAGSSVSFANARLEKDKLRR